MSSYYVGKYKEDAKGHRGWIMGSFMNEGDVRKTNIAEVKIWEFGVGETGHVAKISSTLECTLLLTGRCQAIIDGKEYILSAGDYIVVQPGTPNNLATYAFEPISGVTIKTPSDPTSKKEIKL